MNNKKFMNHRTNIRRQLVLSFNRTTLTTDPINTSPAEFWRLGPITSRSIRSTVYVEQAVVHNIPFTILYCRFLSPHDWEVVLGQIDFAAMRYPECLTCPRVVNGSFYFPQGKARISAAIWNFFALNSGLLRVPLLLSDKG